MEKQCERVRKGVKGLKREAGTKKKTVKVYTYNIKGMEKNMYEWWNKKRGLPVRGLRIRIHWYYVGKIKVLNLENY